MNKETIICPKLCVGCADSNSIGLQPFTDKWRFSRSIQSGGTTKNINAEIRVDGGLCSKCSGIGKSNLNKVGGLLVKVGFIILIVGVILFLLAYLKILIPQSSQNTFLGVGGLIALIGLGLLFRGLKNKVSAPQKWFYKVSVNNDLSDVYIHFKNSEFLNAFIQTNTGVPSSNVKQW